MASFAATMARSTGFFASANHLSAAGAGARPVVLTSHLTVRAAWASCREQPHHRLRQAPRRGRGRATTRRFQMRGQAI